MTKITVIRHGQSQGNVNKIICGHYDTPLTDIGREQAKLTGKHLVGKKIDRIYSSDLCRAKETAEMIAGQIGMNVTVDARLRERSCGIFDGKPVSDAILHPLWDGFISKPHVNVDGGETIGQIYQRAKDFLGFLTNNHKNENIILVTHGGWLWVCVPVVLGVSIDSYYGFIGMDNCSMTNVVFDNGSYVLESLNQTYHLGGLLPDSLSWRF